MEENEFAKVIDELKKTDWWIEAKNYLNFTDAQLTSTVREQIVEYRNRRLGEFGSNWKPIRNRLLEIVEGIQTKGNYKFNTLKCSKCGTGLTENTKEVLDNRNFCYKHYNEFRTWWNEQNKSKECNQKDTKVYNVRF